MASKHQEGEDSLYLRPGHCLLGKDMLPVVKTLGKASKPKEWARFARKYKLTSYSEQELRDEFAKLTGYSAEEILAMAGAPATLDGCRLAACGFHLRWDSGDPKRCQ